MVSFNGCRSSKSDSIADLSKIGDFHEKYSTTASYQQLNDSIDLFIDFSTCVAQAERDPPENAQFYHDVRPRLIHYSPTVTFWSIKGNSISRGYGDLYNLLRGVDEHNYADLKSAVGRIVQNNNQAVLITDGEYFQQNTSRDNYNNPYLGQHFVNWLKKGNDIYILAEPYKENNIYEKFRYYMLFTNHKIENNIYKILKDVIKDHSNLKVVHLSISDFDIYTEYEGINKPDVNQVLALNGYTYFSEPTFEFQEYQIEWSDIVEYIKNAPDPETGKPMTGGDYLLKGIFINAEEIKYHKIEDVDVKVYNVYDAYRTFEDTSYINKTNKFKEISEVFELDKDPFRKDGEIVLKIHKNFSGNGLNSDSENLLKVDIVIKDVKHTFNEYIDNFSIFKWTSISPDFSGMENESVYQSIKNVLEDNTLSPKLINNGILYTIYIKTPCSDLKN